MADLPFYRPREIAPLPGPSLDRERRPQANFGGVADGIGNVMRGADRLEGTNQRGFEALRESMQKLTNSQASPLLPANLFQGEYEGAQAIAAGVGALTAISNLIVEKEAIATNIAHKAEAEGVMSKAYADFEEWKLSDGNLSNPEAWKQAWAERIDGVGRVLTDSKHYSNDLRNQLVLDYQRWAESSMIRVSTDATKAIFNRADVALNAKIGMAVESRDINGVGQLLAEQAALGTKTQEQAELELMEYQKRINHANAADQITINPEGVLSDLALPSHERSEPFRDLSEAKVIQFRGAAMTEVSRQRSIMNASVSEKIKQGEFTKEEELTQYLDKVDPHRRINDKERLYHIDTLQGKPLNMEFVGEVQTMIDKYDPKASDALQQKAGITNALELVGGRRDGKTYAEALLKQFEFKDQVYQDGQEEKFKHINFNIDAQLKGGEFGEIEIPMEMISYDKTRDMWVRSRYAHEEDKTPFPVELSEKNKHKIASGKFKPGDLATDLKAQRDANRKAMELKLYFAQARAEGKYRDNPNAAMDEFQNMMESSTKEEMQKRLNRLNEQTEKNRKSSRMSTNWYQFQENAKQMGNSLPNIDITEDGVPALLPPLNDPEEELNNLINND